MTVKEFSQQTDKARLARFSPDFADFGDAVMLFGPGGKLVGAFGSMQEAAVQAAAAGMDLEEGVCEIGAAEIREMVSGAVPGLSLPGFFSIIPGAV